MNPRRYHGWHWWHGISNEVDCHGNPLTIPRWYVVHCWTAGGTEWAVSAHWTKPMAQHEMAGEWGGEVPPPCHPVVEQVRDIIARSAAQNALELLVRKVKEHLANPSRSTEELWTAIQAAERACEPVEVVSGELPGSAG